LKFFAQRLEYISLVESKTDVLELQKIVERLAKYQNVFYSEAQWNLPDIQSFLAPASQREGVEGEHAYTKKEKFKKS